MTRHELSVIAEREMDTALATKQVASSVLSIAECSKAAAEWGKVLAIIGLQDDDG